MLNQNNLRKTDNLLKKDAKNIIEDMKTQIQTNQIEMHKLKNIMDINLQLYGKIINRINY